MTREEATDCIRRAYDAVINEYAASAAAEDRTRLESLRVIEALAPEFLTDYDKELLAKRADDDP